MTSSSSTEGLVPITRAFLASYYDKYPFVPPLSVDVPLLSDQIHSMALDLLKHDGSPPPTKEESLLIHDSERQPPHKIDENMWKNREQIEEILFLLQLSHRPTALQQDAELDSIVVRLHDKFKSTLKTLEDFQARNSNFIFDTVMTYMPRDFRGTIIRQQRERSERNKQAAVDALISAGGSIHDKYALLWNQQMERRRQLAELGAASGVYKTLVKYLVGVPEVLLDFIRQINDDKGYTLLKHMKQFVGRCADELALYAISVLNSILMTRPMEEQRQRYGPPLYSLTTLVRNIRVFLSLLWARLETTQLQKNQISTLEKAADVYTSEFERFINFIGEVLTNSPFFITAEDACTLEARNSDDYKEISVPAGQTHEVSLKVESVNSYIAWDFSVVQGTRNLDVGFSVECTDLSGSKALILPYRRYESDQGNFCTCVPGNYKLVWDNSYSTFFKKVVRYKVDCIPPVVEPVPAAYE